jgi:membrane-bound lytic murein transglycosylase D
MYSVSIQYQYNLLKALIIFIFISSFGSISQAQTEYNNQFNSIYAKEFKQFRSLAYNLDLIALSKNKPNTKWNKYKGGAINTTKSNFFFNNELLAKAFPTNSDKLRNEYLAFYFSQKTAKCPTLFSLLKYYEPILAKHITLTQLPKELKLLPVVCSAFNPRSDNGIGGYGYWHLNYPQAIKYGLIVNGLIDERSDFEKSTQAATLYIKDLYALYNDWELTLTAYSSGVTTLNKLLNRYSAKTYKEIYPYLPKETQDLVQAFVAMNYIFSYDQYGAVHLNPILAIDTIQIERKLQLEAINYVLKTNTKELQFLNPTVLKETFPNEFTAYFPKGMSEKFRTHKDSIYFYQDSVMNKPKSTGPKFLIPKDGEPYIYTVRSGDVLGLIARRNKVRVSQLQEWNGLNGTRINVGQKLTIYAKSKQLKVSSKKVLTEKKEKRKKKKKALAPSTKKTKSQTPNTNSYSAYTVKSGDNLWLIAKKYSGVSAQNLMDFNGIDGNLTVGQKIKIPKY